MVLAATGNRVGFSMIPKHRRDSLHRAATTIRAYDETEDDLQDNSDADHGRTAIVGQPNKQDSLKTIRCRRGQVTIVSLKNLAGEPPFRRWGATKLAIPWVFHNSTRERGVDFRFHEPEAHFFRRCLGWDQRLRGGVSLVGVEPTRPFQGSLDFKSNASAISPQRPAIACECNAWHGFGIDLQERLPRLCVFGFGRYTEDVEFDWLVQPPTSPIPSISPKVPC